MANKTENPVQKAVLSQIKPGDVSVTESRIHPLAFATYIRALLQNWRQGTVGVKGRSDVRHTGKKPWKQKGTGRARAGDSRSPLWRGGGVTFGPQPRTKTLKVTKATKRKVLNTLFFDYVNDGKLFSLDWAPEGSPKTASAHSVLKQAELAGKKIALFVAADDFATQASFANIPLVQILYFDQPNAFHTAHADYWVFLKKDMDSFTKMVEQWN